MLWFRGKILAFCLAPVAVGGACLGAQVMGCGQADEGLVENKVASRGRGKRGGWRRKAPLVVMCGIGSNRTSADYACTPTKTLKKGQ